MGEHGLPMRQRQGRAEHFIECNNAISIQHRSATRELIRMPAPLYDKPLRQ
jgi:hypothetical protein